jgi:hypothetical protein
MKRKELPEYDNDLFADMIRRYIHRETDRRVLTEYFCNGKSTTTIATELDFSTRQVWNIKDRNEGYLFRLYDRIYGEK